MPKKVIYLLLLVLSGMNLSAQQTVKLKDGKEYRATPVWDFICDDYALTGKVQTQIAKTEKGGVLKIGVQVTNDSFYIGGTVYIYLEDNSFITCTDKGLREHADNMTYAYYTFTPAEIAKLRKSPIKDLRFSVKGTQSAFSSQTGYFTATNRASYFELYDKSIKNIFETNKEVSQLYN